MTCEESTLLLSMQLDGELTPEEEGALKAHLAQCPQCRVLAAQLEDIQTSMAQLADEPAPEGFAQGVMDRIRAQEQPASKVVPLFRRPQVRAVAGVAACLAVCLGLWRSGQPTQQPPTHAKTFAVSVEPEETETRDKMPTDLPAPAALEEPEQTPGSKTSDPSAAKPSTASEPAPILEPAPQPQQQERTTPGDVPEEAEQLPRALTLEREPEGLDLSVLHWFMDEAGSLCLIVPPEAVAEYEAMAREQGIKTRREADLPDGSQVLVVILPS